MDFLSSLNYYKELFSFHNDSTKKFQEEYIDILPEDWTVCLLSITADYKHLFVVRLQRETLPVVVKIETHRPPSPSTATTKLVAKQPFSQSSVSTSTPLQFSELEREMHSSRRKRKKVPIDSIKKNTKSIEAKKEFNEKDNIFLLIRDKFTSIMKVNQETTNITALNRECMSDEEKLEWWQKRETADQLLQELLDNDMETLLLGPWKVSLW
jgi:RecA-family ATPase